MAKKSMNAEEFTAHCEEQAQRLSVFARRGWPFERGGQVELAKRLETVAGTDKRTLPKSASARATAVIDECLTFEVCPTPADLLRTYTSLFGSPEDGKIPPGCAACQATNGRVMVEGKTTTGTFAGEKYTAVAWCKCSRGQALRAKEIERNTTTARRAHATPLEHLPMPSAKNFEPTGKEWE